jgi:WD40 repeat protein
MGWCAFGTPSTGEVRRSLEGDTGWVRALAFSADGSLVACAGEIELRLWDAATGQTRRTLEGHTDMVEALAFSPDGSWLASAGDEGELHLWDPDSAGT